MENKNINIIIMLKVKMSYLSFLSYKLKFTNRKEEVDEIEKIVLRLKNEIIDLINSLDKKEN